jgi:hypothetical protein
LPFKNSISSEFILFFSVCPFCFSLFSLFGGEGKMAGWNSMGNHVETKNVQKTKNIVFLFGENRLRR